jgi:chitinase
VKYEAEHVVEFQLIKHFFIDLDRNLGPFPDPADANKQLKFCPLVKKLWNIQPVAIPTLTRRPRQTLVLGVSPAPNYNEIQLIDFKKWIGGDPSDYGSPVNQDDANSKKSLITDIGGAEKIMKSLRAIVGSCIHHSDAHVMSILQKQKERVGGPGREGRGRARRQRQAV